MLVVALLIYLSDADDHGCHLVNQWDPQTRDNVKLPL